MRATQGPANYTRFQMGSWYWIGVCAGLGVAVGVLLAGFLTGARAALTVAGRIDPKWKAMLAKLPPVMLAPPPRAKP